MRIANNTSSYGIWSTYTNNQNEYKKSMERLSTGKKLITDDVAGAGIASRMNSEVSALASASKNATSGISMLQTADSWMDKINEQLTRMKALVVENNGVVSSTDQANIAEEFNNLRDEIVRITGTSSADASSAGKFNGINLFGGSDKVIQIGGDVGQTLTIDLDDLTGDNLASGFATASVGGTGMLASMEAAVNKISASRAKLGSQQVRLNHTIDGITKYSENLQTSASKISDVDMAKESTNMTKYQILTNASLAMLGQSNNMGQNVLSLLG